MMRALLDTIQALSSTRITSHKVSILEDHVRRSDARDLRVEIPILLGRPTKRIVTLSTLRDWAVEFVGDRVAPDVLEAAFAHVRNTSAAIALLVSVHRDPSAAVSTMSTAEIIAALDAAAAASTMDALHDLVMSLWNTLPDSRVLNDILLGRHVHWCTESQLATAIARAHSLDRHAVIYALHFGIDPVPRPPFPRPPFPRPPSPFMQPHHADLVLDTWLDTTQWACEPKYDGMRAQAVITNGEVVLWSMHGDIIDVGDAVVAALLEVSRDLIVDGELVDNRTRYIPFDLLDVDGIDLRHKPYAERRALLLALLRTGDGEMGGSGDGAHETNHPSTSRKRLPHPPISPSTHPPSEGVVYKRLTSPYAAGTDHTDWHAVRFPRTVITCMLMYAIGDEFTFGVQHDGAVVNIIQLSSGIPSHDRDALLAWVRDHQTGRDGPARLVAPGLLVRISYTTLHPAPRRKIGVKLNNPRWEGLGGETLSEM